MANRLCAIYFVSHRFIMKGNKIDIKSNSIDVDFEYTQSGEIDLKDLTLWALHKRLYGADKCKLTVDFGWEGELFGVTIESIDNGD